MQCAASIPHSDAAGQDALDGASVEGAHDGGGGWCSLQLAEEVEAPLGLLGQWCGIGCSGEILTDVNPQELGAARSLHSSTVNVQLGFRSGDPPEIDYNLLGLLDVQEEVGISTLRGQLADLPAVGLIVVGHETNHSCVIRKLHNVVSTE